MAHWPTDLNEKMTEARVKALTPEPPRPRHVHRISDVGHPCERYLYHAIVDWDKRPPVEPSLQGIFDTGNLLEKEMFKFFNNEVGPRMNPPMCFIKPQTDKTDKLLRQYNISGTEDWHLCYEDHHVDPVGVVDGKSASENAYRGWSDLESLKRSPYAYKYNTQVQLYNFANNFECGGLLFYNKTNPYHDWKLIDVPVDFGYVEEILQKCERVNVAIDNIESGEMPPKICEPFWCTTCPFESICLPELEIEGAGAKLNTSDELERMVALLLELKPSYTEYTNVLKDVKSHLVKGQDLVTKSAVITWKKQTVNMPAKEAYSYTKHFPVFTMGDE
jgi:hypothetical protein